MTGPTNRPTRISTLAAIVFAIVGAYVNAMTGQLQLLLGVGGVLLFTFGMLIGSRDILSAATIVIFIEALSASLYAPILNPLLGAASILAAWYVGENAISLGDHLGRNAPTRSHEFSTIVFAVGIGGLSTGVAVSADSLALAPLSVIGIAIMCVALVILGTALTH